MKTNASVGEGKDEHLQTSVVTNEISVALQKKKKKLEIDLPQDPAIPLFAIYSRGIYLTAKILAHPCSLLYYNSQGMEIA